MLRLASVPAGNEWVERIAQAVTGMAWAEQEEAFSSNTLLHIAQRCRRAETLDVGMRFVKLMCELLFAAKVNRYTGSGRLFLRLILAYFSAVSFIIESMKINFWGKRPAFAQVSAVFYCLAFHPKML